MADRHDFSRPSVDFSLITVHFNARRIIDLRSLTIPPRSQWTRPPYVRNPYPHVRNQSTDPTQLPPLALLNHPHRPPIMRVEQTIDREGAHRMTGPKRVTVQKLAASESERLLPTPNQRARCLCKTNPFFAIGQRPIRNSQPATLTFDRRRETCDSRFCRVKRRVLCRTNPFFASPGYIGCGSDAASRTGNGVEVHTPTGRPTIQSTFSRLKRHSRAFQCAADATVRDAPQDADCEPRLPRRKAISVDGSAAASRTGNSVNRASGRRQVRHGNFGYAERRRVERGPA
jgi:hypothetical protein